MTQICNKCSEELPLEAFTKSKTKPKGRMYICKSCRAVYEKERRLTKPLTEEQREKAKEKSSLWRSVNVEQNKEMKRNWALQNRHIKAFSSSVYKARKLKAQPPWLSESQKEQIIEFYWMSKDLKKISGEDYHVDHIVPLQGRNVCGLHVPWNLQILPVDLNLAKHNIFREA